MVNRAIVIFPQFSNNVNLIQDIRDRYDPLAQKILPHITLVFPFESKISSSELNRHMQNVLSGVKPFDIALKGISYEDQYYLFLNLIKGKKEISEIHNLLYSGLLSKLLSQKRIYQPHLTVGHFNNLSTAKTAMEELSNFRDRFETRVTKITTEIISANLASTVDFELDL